MHAPTGRREEILAIAAELFAAKGIAATTVRDIGDAAGVLSGSLYHFFRSKDAIVGELLSRYVQDIHGRFAAAVQDASSPADQVRSLIRETLLVIDEHPHPTRIYQNDRPYLREHGLLETVDAASRKVRAFWLDAIRAGVEDGSFRGDVPPEVFYRAVRDSLWATTHWPDRQRYSTAEFSDLMTELFFAGFVTAAGAATTDGPRRA